jgi:hypothetical protein
MLAGCVAAMWYHCRCPVFGHTGVGVDAQDHVTVPHRAAGNDQGVAGAGSDLAWLFWLVLVVIGCKCCGRARK